MKCTLQITDIPPVKVQEVRWKAVSKASVGGGRMYGRVYVPESWIGQKVVIALLEPGEGPET
jgi:hypothetical protein